MKVIRHYTELSPEEKGSVVALGNFDGVHRGHRVVLNEARQTADYFGVPLGVVTFEPHPQEFFRPSDHSMRLSTSEQKARLLKEAGVDLLFVLPFDEDLSKMSAQDFVVGVLLQQLGVIHIVMGYDFRFGNKRGGDPTLLRYMGEMEGFGVTIVDKVTEAGAEQSVFSSSLIRSHLQEGRPRDAARLLGRPWAVEGTVAKGDARGRTMGFPTANLPLKGLFEPALGVYAVVVNIEEDGEMIAVPAVANIGRRPTFGVNDVQLEAFLLDFDGDLYDRHLRVDLIEFIRPERKFENIEALTAQIARDVEQARSILGAAQDSKD